MENVAHAIAGVLVAEALLQARERFAGQARTARAGRAAYVVSALSNNIPDADILYLGITPGKLGYLVHHRGHTHTLVVGVLLGIAVALLTLATLAIVRRVRALPPLGPGDARFLIALGALGPIVHIGMDGWNNYGVHPFWPIYAGWFYGDSIFIVEPLLWLTALPFVIALASSRAFRLVLVAFFLVMIVLPWRFTELVPLPARLAFIAVAAASAAAAFRLSRAPASSSRRRLLGAAVGAWLVVVGAFAIASRVAKHHAIEAAAEEIEGARVLDVAATPMPGNFFCFATIVTAITPEGDVALVYGRTASVPSLVSAEACPLPFEDTTAPLHPPATSGSRSVTNLGTFRAPVAELRELAARCDVSALLQFVRVPFWTPTRRALVVGDARFDRDIDIDFAEVELGRDAPDACPKNLPGWRPPRSDLLEER